VMKLVSDFQQVGGFSPGTLVSSINTTDRHDITEILCKVVLNTITLTHFSLWLNTKLNIKTHIMHNLKDILTSLSIVIVL